MIVIYRNGQRTVISGWRAWLLVLPAVLVAALIIIVLGAIFLGIAVTALTIFLFGLPLAALLALIVYLIRPKQASAR
jgi:hypothetical protein